LIGLLYFRVEQRDKGIGDKLCHCIAPFEVKVFSRNGYPVGPFTWDFMVPQPEISGLTVIGRVNK
jgi:hypothetical protein